ncbi:MAG: aldo/keto reductase [Fimbriimonadaceae bacterium]|nr:aldo/keto reductase [Fimbriimonadaceae bacterium]
MSRALTLPGTDLAVSRLCLGTGGVGTTIPEEKAGPLFDRFAELGGTFLDTAAIYGDWEPTLPKSMSERVIGRWLKSTGLAGKMVVATKGGHPTIQEPDRGRLGAADLREDLERSLDLLGLDRIDLYWLHADERSRPVGEILDSLWGFQDEGLVRNIGASNWQLDRLEEAAGIAKSRGRTGFVADQTLWNAARLATRPYGSENTGWMHPERHEFLLREGMAAIPYQAQAFGLFHRMAAGTLDQMNAGFRGFYEPQERDRRFGVMQAIMAETGATIHQVVLGYLTGQELPTVPILGCQNPAQVAESMTALDFRLTKEQIERIDGGVKGTEPAALA